MRKIVITQNISLDGVMQAPGRPDEDARGGFSHGGWAGQYNDDVMGREMGKGMATTGALLFGRRTYEDFYRVWPSRRDNPISDLLTNTPKFVASRTLEEPLPWVNSTLLERDKSGDVMDSVRALTTQEGGDIVVIGSGDLTRSLLASDLVDRLVLLIHPLVLGSGQRLFADDGPLMSVTLVSSVPTTTGVVIATYERQLHP